MPHDIVEVEVEDIRPTHAYSLKEYPAPAHYFINVMKNIMQNIPGVQYGLLVYTPRHILLRTSVLSLGVSAVDHIVAPSPSNNSRITLNAA